MSFVWPAMLLTLVLVPVAVLLYMNVQRRRRALRESLVRLGGKQPVSVAAGKKDPGLRRHIPPALFLLALMVLLVALARPQATLDLPRVEGTVILVFDVSGSMAATDVEPSRIEAAKAAAREYVQNQPETVRIGVVSFSGSGFAVQQPTSVDEEVLAVIDRLEPQTGTSLGQGIAVALNTIALDAGLEPVQPPVDGSNPSANPSDPSGGGSEPSTGQEAGRMDGNILAQLPEGSFPSAMIVLLSDGENNMSLDPLEAAQAAAERDVRIDALGFGTTAGTVLELEGFSVHTALNEAALQQIAQAAGGSYYNAQRETDAQALSGKITPRLVIKPEAMEITALLAGMSIVMLLAGAAFSLVWFGRVP